MAGRPAGLTNGPSGASAHRRKDCYVRPARSALHFIYALCLSPARARHTVQCSAVLHARSRRNRTCLGHEAARQQLRIKSGFFGFFSGGRASEREAENSRSQSAALLAGSSVISALLASGRRVRLASTARRAFCGHGKIRRLCSSLFIPR